MFLVERQETLPVVPVEARAARAPGLHLSDIIHDLCKTLDPDRFSREEEDAEFADLEEVPIIYLGMAYEERLERTLDLQASRVASYRPSEMSFLGIAMNADRISFDPPRPGIDPEPADADLPPVVEEHKLTKMSGNHEIDSPKFRHWFWQLQFYCAGYGTTRGRIRAFFVNSDYRFGKTPPDDPRSRLYRVWDVRFTPREILDNTTMLVQHARRRGWMQ